MSEVTGVAKLSIKEAAKILEVSDAAIYLYVKGGKLTPIKEGHRTFFDKAEVEEFKKNKPTRGKRAKKTDASEAPAKPEKPKAKAKKKKVAAKLLAVKPTPGVIPVQPPSTPPSSVPVGSVIELTPKGLVWRLNPETLAWTQANDVSLSVKVVERNKNGEQTFLLCKAPGSLGQWSVAESDVLNGTFNLIQVPHTPEVPTSPPPAVATPVATRADEKAAEAVQKEKELMEAKMAYSAALHAYVAANDNKLSSASIFGKVNKEHRPVIWDYLEEKGEESEEGKGDKVVEDFGYRAIITFTPGKTVTQLDAAKIVEWALTNQQTGVLTYSVDTKKWDELKETGVVPAEFIAAVEKPKKLDDARKLVINKVKGKADNPDATGTLSDLVNKERSK